MTLSAAELEQMRETASDALGGTAIIQTKSFVSDGGGGGTTTWAASGTADCRLAPYVHGSGERVEADRLSPDSEVLFTFPAETSVALDSQIVHAGGTFTVTAIRRRTDEITRRVEAKEVT
jgi:hypothetical protein